MEKENARHRLRERRKQVVRLHVQGIKIMQIVALCGLTYPTVKRAIELYERGGWQTLRLADRGRGKSQGCVLTKQQEDAIQGSIIDQRLEAVQVWLDVQYPAIEAKAKAKAQGADIHCGDETALVNTDVRGRSYAPAGKTPVAFTPGGARHKLSIIASVTNQGKARWMIIDEAFNSDQLIEFLEALTKDACKKVLLILDNLRLHHSEPVKAWVAERVDRIELFNLPSYSPELNLEGQLNADLKQAMGRRVTVRPKAKLRDAANDHMVTLERSPERVRSFFLDQKVKYAALNFIGLYQ